ncbi:hypothetical protein J31TS4_13540 [Paenibacillus sp. J31TS4]|nr:hypothetical protein J31TS4_13540 [Paenibacillus sp. J31TS4]
MNNPRSAQERALGRKRRKVSLEKFGIVAYNWLNKASGSTALFSTEEGAVFFVCSDRQPGGDMAYWQSLDDSTI